jgi:CRISPR-associated protein Cas1
MLAGGAPPALSEGSQMQDEALLSVAGLHALAYCERLFYLEEVERIRIADASVYAGRRLHVEEVEQEEGEWQRLALQSDKLDLQGAVDVLKRRDGQVVPYEHKRGRSAGKAGAREAWRTDRIQVGAYAMLVEEAHGQPVVEGRIRYHADRVTVRVPIDEGLRSEVRSAIARARELRTSVERPPIADNEKLCVRCSLSSVCLPEEARLAKGAAEKPIRLLPQHQDRQTIHVLEQGATVGRYGQQLAVRSPEGAEERIPVAEVGALVLHGYSQVSTQALRLCVEREVGVHWVSMGGTLIGSLAPGAGPAQRHLRQFAALGKEDFALQLARRLVSSKIDGQLRFVLRATREEERRGQDAWRALATLRSMVRRANHATARDELLGIEGSAAAAYFAFLPSLLLPELDERLRLDGRTRHPPRDCFNALLSYGYGMLYREVLGAIVGVGLHPGMGFYHQPRSSAHTLALDLMEIFRVPLVDMAVVAALNRRTFDADEDFVSTPGQVLLSNKGRPKAIEGFERRRMDSWRHSAVGYSLSYARMIELEVRLLEKEWMGEGGLFARFRLR